MVKQSWSSTRSRPATSTSAMASARSQAAVVPANASGSRFAAGRKSLAWPKPARRTGSTRPPVGRVESTRAAAPSDTGEQSVRRSGSATTGLRSETVRQKSSPRSLRSCA